MKRLALHSRDIIPNSTQQTICYTAAHPWQAWVKQDGAVAAFEQLRRLGGQTSVRFLIGLLAPGVIT